MNDDEMVDAWLEHWLVVGHVSDAAIEAILSVDGKVEHMHSFNCHARAVCFLYSDPEDSDVGFSFSNDDEALKIDVFSADEHITLYLYSTYFNPDRDVADVKGLSIVTEGEYFKIMDKKNGVLES